MEAERFPGPIEPATKRGLDGFNSVYLSAAARAIDAAVLQLRRRAEILCGGDRQPLFNKAIKADGDDFPSSFGFLVFVQAMTSLFRLIGVLMIRAYHTLQDKSSSCLDFIAYFFLDNHS